jgi:hypothetical protein
MTVARHGTLSSAATGHGATSENCLLTHKGQAVEVNAVGEGRRTEDEEWWVRSDKWACATSRASVLFSRFMPLSPCSRPVIRTLQQQPETRG